MQIDFYVKIAISTWLKSSSFSHQSPLKVKVLSSTLFIKIWLEAQPTMIIQGQQKNHIWNRVRLSLRGKILSETKSLFPSYDSHRPNLHNFKISKKKLKKVYAVFSGTGKNRISQKVSSNLHLEGQARYFTVFNRHKIKLDKNKMDSKFTKSHQCSLPERSHAVFWLKLIPNSDQDLLNKNRFLQVYQSQKFTKTEQWRFLYSIILCLATSHQ